MNELRLDKHKERLLIFHFVERFFLWNGLFCYEGLPGVLGNKGTLAKYRREQGNISQFLGTGEQNPKNYSTKTFGKCVGTWEHRAILEGNKGTRTPPPLGDPLLSFRHSYVLGWFDTTGISRGYSPKYLYGYVPPNGFVILGPLI